MTVRKDSPALLESHASRPYGTYGTYQQLADIEHQAEQGRKLLEVLQSRLAGGYASKEDMQQISNIALRSFDGLDMLLAPAKNAIPLEERVSRSSAVSAKRVFGIAELVDMILGFCRPIEIVRLRNADISETISVAIGSRKWQMRAGFYPSDGAFSVPAHFLDVEDGLGIKVEPIPSNPYIKDYYVEDQLRVTVSLNMPSLNYELWQRKLSNRKEIDMLIVQPPVYQLAFYTECCARVPEQNPRWDASNSNKATRVVTMANGFTVGNVLDVFVQLQKEHRTCPEAKYDQHRADGVVRPAIQAQGVFSVSPEDSAVKDMIVQHAKDKTTRTPSPDGILNKLGDYVKAKYYGKSM